MLITSDITCSAVCESLKSNTILLLLALFAQTSDLKSNNDCDVQVLTFNFSLSVYIE